MTIPHLPFRLLPMAIAALLAACSAQTPNNSVNASAAEQGETRVPLVIRTGAARHRFDVEIALTAQDQAKGLMFRTALAPDAGMVFPMSPPRTASFWMKDTLIPLDMLFIGTDGRIVFIRENATPYSREPVSAGVPVAAVLELQGGRAKALGLGEGDQVAWGSCALEKAPAKVRDPLNFCPA